MSNVLTTNPMLLDSANTSTVVLSRQFFVNGVLWNSGSSGVAGDTLVLKDKNGNVLVDISIEAAKQSKFIPFSKPQPFDGLIAHTIAHGTAYLYTQESKNV